MGNRVMSWRSCLLVGVVLCVPGLARADRPGWKVGVAVRKITPAESMWMAGYASRTRPAEGKEQDLYVKALALQDPAGTQSVLLTSDLIGIPRSLSEAVYAEVKKKAGL